MPGGTGFEHASPRMAAASAARPLARCGPGRLELCGLLVVMIVAGLLRVPALDAFPPGLNQDEASNAWNAWCLLKTGQDQVGEGWPIFCFRALGEFRSALFLYVMLPFQVVGGLNVWTTRLPAAVGGLATVLLVWWVGRRMFGARVGLVTAALLAIDPTHVQMSRLGHEASITPLLALAPLALLIWAGFPIVSGGGRFPFGIGGIESPDPVDFATRAPGLLRATIAGLVIGACCYGYPAVRLYVPVFLIAAVLLTIGGWRRLTRSRQGRLSVAALCLGFLITFGPLVWQHVAHPETIGRRGAATWAWRAGDPIGVRAAKVVERYVRHFDPRFLYVNGDEYEVLWTAGPGYIPWPLLALQIAGLVLLMPRWRESAAARVLVAGVLLFPAADCLNWHVSMHGLRSSVGLAPLLMLAAVGVVWTAGTFKHARQQAAVVAISAALVLHFALGFGYNYIFVRPQHKQVYFGTHRDVLAAHDFLAPRVRPGDMVIFSDRDMNQPYVVWLLASRYDPQRWFAEPRDMQSGGEWDRYTRFGDLYFLDADERAALLGALGDNGRTDHVFVVVRPGEEAPGTRIHTIPGPDDVPALLLYEAWM